MHYLMYDEFTLYVLELFIVLVPFIIIGVFKEKK